MGTSNFYNKNASSIFALDIKDQWDLECQFDSIACHLANELGYHSYCLDKAPTENGGLRSFTGRIIGETSKRHFDREREVELIVSIKAIIRSGYYDGANLDWTVETEKIHYEPLNSDEKQFLHEAREELVNELETAYKQFSTELGVTARASNGTCMYHKK